MYLIPRKDNRYSVGPFQGFLDLDSDLRQWVRDAFSMEAASVDAAKVALAIPRADIRETEKEIVVSFDIPGVKKQDIKARVEDQHLIVEAHRISEQKKENDGYLRKERHEGRWQRSIELPSYASTDAPGAVYEDGVLTVKIQKTDPSKTKGRQIEIK